MVETTLPFGASVVKGVIPKLRVDEREREFKSVLTRWVILLR